MSALHLAHLVLTLVTVVFVGSAAVANLLDHSFPRRQARQLQVPLTWVRPLGGVLGLGALGTLLGLALPALGALATAGLVLYFLLALGAHLRIGDRHFGPWALYFTLASSTLALNLLRLLD